MGDIVDIEAGFTWISLKLQSQQQALAQDRIDHTELISQGLSLVVCRQRKPLLGFPQEPLDTMAASRNIQIQAHRVLPFHGIVRVLIEFN